MSGAAEERRLVFEAVEVGRMPGIHRGFTLDALSEGVNVVYGPNASGKTTTARAIEALLWPEAAPARARLAGRFRLGGAAWRVDVDAGHVAHQRDGADAEPPALPPAGARDRYRISLHELLATDDGHLAEAIVRESAGGYDVAGAAEALGFSARPSRPLKLGRALDAARKTLREARAAEDRLRSDEERLRELEARKTEAEAAARRAEALERAVALAAAREDEAAARAALEAFPEALVALRGDEADRVDNLDEQLDEARRRRRDLEQEIAAAERVIRDTGLADDGAPDALLPALRERLEAAREAEREIATLRQEVEKAGARRADARRLLGADADDTRLAAVDTAGMDELAEFARRSGELRERREALKRARTLLEADDADTGEDADVLRRGVWLLGRWLGAGGESPAAGRLRRHAWAAAALALAASAVLTITVHPGFAAGVLLALGVAVLAARAGDGDGRDRTVHRREFERLGLDVPARWTPEAVEQAMDALQRRWAAAALAAERRRAAETLAREAGALDAEQETLEARRRELAARLGVPPDTEEAKLSWLAERIGRWQDAAAEARAAGAALEAARERRAEALAALADRLEPYGYGPFDDAADATGAVDALERRIHEHADAARDLRTARDRRDDAVRDIERLEAERREIFDAAGLAIEDVAALRSLCERCDDYQAARDRLLRAERDRETAEERLRTHPAYDAAMEGEARAVLEEARREAEAAAARLDEVREEITRIQTEIDRAKRAHDVEAALAEVERAEAALRDARTHDARAVVGHLLAERLRQATRDHGRPRVFHRARQIFADITRGRYRLDFDDGDPPAFRAYDTTTGTGHALDELSSGTRVQLLLAVRIAFVETQEQGARLPLVLDEALGNSDDERARAIMDAALALARNGRQIFYFTAQPDEVGKWRALLDDAGDVPHRLVDLAEVRRMEPAAELPRATVERPAPPAPDGLDHAAYGERLGVPPLDLRAPDVGATHLWHLLDDPEALHSLLRLGVSTWGELRTLMEHGGDGLEVARDSYRRAEAAARALEEIRSLWAVGRGRPVDRAVLVDSGAVSETFLDRVDALCRELDGDADRLLAALEAGRVKRFQTNKREELQDYLEEHGYLDRRDRLPLDQIRARTLAAVAAELADGRLDPAHIDRLLAWAAPAAATPPM